MQRTGCSAMNFLRLFVLAIGLVGATLATAADKVVFQVTENDEAKWNLVFNNVRNLKAAVGPAAEVEIVAYGPGILPLKKGSAVGSGVTELAGRNVKVLVCENTMKAMNLVASDMLADVSYVPSGVVEVMQKQQQGYAYLRP